MKKYISVLFVFVCIFSGTDLLAKPHLDKIKVKNDYKNDDGKNQMLHLEVTWRDRHGAHIRQMKTADIPSGKTVTLKAPLKGYGLYKVQAAPSVIYTTILTSVVGVPGGLSILAFIDAQKKHGHKFFVVTAGKKPMGGNLRKASVKGYKNEAEYKKSLLPSTQANVAANSAIKIIIDKTTAADDKTAITTAQTACYAAITSGSQDDFAKTFAAFNTAAAKSRATGTELANATAALKKYNQVVNLADVKIIAPTAEKNAADAAVKIIIDKTLDQANKATLTAAQAAVYAAIENGSDDDYTKTIAAYTAATTNSMATDAEKAAALAALKTYDEAADRDEEENAQNMADSAIKVIVDKTTAAPDKTAITNAQTACYNAIANGSNDDFTKALATFNTAAAKSTATAVQQANAVSALNAYNKVVDDNNADDDDDDTTNKAAA